MVMGEVTLAPESAPTASTHPDIPLADFEGETWEQTGWVSEGAAFATGPQTGAQLKGEGGDLGQLLLHPLDERGIKSDRCQTSYRRKEDRGLSATTACPTAGGPADTAA